MGKVIGLTFESSASKRTVDSKNADTNSGSRTNARNNTSQPVIPSETENDGGDK